MVFEGTQLTAIALYPRKIEYTPIYAEQQSTRLTVLSAEVQL